MGRDSSAVADELSGEIDVIKIISGADDFAALREDGSVVTWGYEGGQELWPGYVQPAGGGDSSSVASELSGEIDVIDIVGNYRSYSALREDGSVITWGHADYGGDSSAVADELW